MFTDPWSAHYVCYPGTRGAPAEFMRLWQIFGARSSDSLSADNGKIVGNCLHNGDMVIFQSPSSSLSVFRSRRGSVPFALHPFIPRKCVRTSLMTDDVNRAGWRLVSLNLVIGYHKLQEVGGSRLPGRLSSFVRAFHALLDNNAGWGG